MFDLFADAPEAEQVFAAATDVLVEDPRRFVRDAEDAALQRNRASQLLIVTRSLVAQSCLVVTMSSAGASGRGTTIA